MKNKVHGIKLSIPAIISHAILLMIPVLVSVIADSQLISAIYILVIFIVDLFIMYKRKYFNEFVITYLIQSFLVLSVILAGNFYMKDTTIVSDYTNRIRLIFVNEEGSGVFQGIYVLPEIPTNVKSTDKVNMNSWGKTYNEIKVSKDDLYKYESDNLSPYVKDKE